VRPANRQPEPLPAAPANGRAPALALALDADALRPLVRAVVAEVLASLEAANARLPDRLAYSEAEAARLLGLNPHQLRDERLRGRVAASKIVGGRIAYTRADLEAYLLRGRAPAGGQAT
jgi:hypothetical protein